MKTRGFFPAIILCLCFLITACEKPEPITLPPAEEIIGITVTSGDGSVTYEETKRITQIIAEIRHAKPTNKQSVQDAPQKDSIRLDIKTEEETVTLFIYKDGSRYYIERPYQGIYETDSNFYEFVSTPQTAAGIFSLPPFSARLP